MKSISPSELNPNTKVFVPSFLAPNTLCQEKLSTESSAQIFDNTCFWGTNPNLWFHWTLVRWSLAVNVVVYDSAASWTLQHLDFFLHIVSTIWSSYYIYHTNRNRNIFGNYFSSLYSAFLWIYFEYHCRTVPREPQKEKASERKSISNFTHSRDDISSRHSERLLISLPISWQIDFTCHYTSPENTY